MPSRNCTFIFNSNKLNFLVLFGSNPIESLYIYEKEIESCIYPSPSFTLFSLVTLAVGNVKNGRGRGGRTALSAPYSRNQSQAVRQEAASCMSQPGLPLLSLSHGRPAFSAVSQPHCSAGISGWTCWALLQEQRSRAAGTPQGTLQSWHRASPTLSEYSFTVSK